MTGKQTTTGLKNPVYQFWSCCNNWQLSYFLYSDYVFTFVLTVCTGGIILSAWHKSKTGGCCVRFRLQYPSLASIPSSLGFFSSLSPLLRLRSDGGRPHPSGVQQRGDRHLDREALCLLCSVLLHRASSGITSDVVRCFILYKRHKHVVSDVSLRYFSSQWRNRCLCIC